MQSAECRIEEIFVTVGDKNSIKLILDCEAKKLADKFSRYKDIYVQISSRSLQNTEYNMMKIFDDSRISTIILHSALCILHS